MARFLSSARESAICRADRGEPGGLEQLDDMCNGTLPRTSARAAQAQPPYRLTTTGSSIQHAHSVIQHCDGDFTLKSGCHGERKLRDQLRLRAAPACRRHVQDRIAAVDGPTVSADLEEPGLCHLAYVFLSGVQQSKLASLGVLGGRCLGGGDPACTRGRVYSAVCCMLYSVYSCIAV